MRRYSGLLMTAAAIAGLVLPTAPSAAAATTATYDLAGTASASLFPQVAFSGTAKPKSRTEAGSWTAAFPQDLGAILPGGTFTFTSQVRTVQYPIIGGTFGTGLSASPSGSCAKTTIPVHGDLGIGGSFDVTLTRFGSLSSGSCVVFRSTVRGTATLTFP